MAVSAISVETSGLDSKMRDLVRDQVPFALKLAVNDLAKDTRRVEQIEARLSFRSPTPWTLRRFHVVKWANKRDPVALLSGQGRRSEFFGKQGQQAQRVLEPHIEGAPRRLRSSEHRLRESGQIGPGDYLVNVAVDRYGNVKGPTYQQMLSYFRAYRGRSKSGASRLRRLNRSDTAGAGTQGVVYFMRRMRDGDVGIFRRRGRKGKPKLIWLVKSGRPKYATRFDFYEIAQEHARRYAEVFADRAIAKALATAR